MEEATSHVFTRKHLNSIILHKHGVPPTKRMFKAAMLDRHLKFMDIRECLEDLGLPIMVQLLRSTTSKQLLKEQNPSEQSRLRIFLSKEILEGGMIRIHSAFVHDESGAIIDLEPR
ncbi:hypothetical protein Tco_0558033 [Tanacetum coccineum]